MLFIGEGSAIEVIHQCTCSLIATLAAAIHGKNIILSALVDCLYRLEEVLCRPSMLFCINILEGIRLLEHGLIDCHAVRNHSKGILIVLSVRRCTGIFYIFINVLRRLIFKNIFQVYHKSFCAPVCHESFRAFHDEVRCRFSFNRRIDLIVSVRIIQVFYRNVHIRILLIEVFQERIDRFTLPPLSNRISEKL